MNKDTSAVRESVKATVTAEWSQLGLGGEVLLTTLQEACEKAIGETPETVFASLLQPLAGLDARGTDLTPVRQVIDRLGQALGRPGDSLGTSPRLAEPLDRATTVLSATVAEKLASFVTSFIEQSGLRLAGAEEAVRQAVTLIEQELRNQERLGQELRARAEAAHSRIHALLESTSQESGHKNRRAAAPVKDLVDLLQGYPIWQYQSLIFQRLSDVYVSLRGCLTDQLREINYCRTRLTELLSNFQDPFAQGLSEEGGRWNRFVFPAGFRNLTDAAKQMLASITPDQLGELDALVQKQLQRQFQGLTYVCLASANLLMNVQQTMQQEAETFVDARLAGVSVADMYLEHHGGEEEAHKDLDTAYHEAVPEFVTGRDAPETEICILAAPRSPVGERFRDLIRHVLPDVNFVPAAGTDDILFYREIPHLRLTDVDQLGPLGYDAYRQIITLKNLTPHSRTDIYEWRAAGG
jgi:hypothetical protein